MCGPETSLRNRRKGGRGGGAGTREKNGELGVGTTIFHPRSRFLSPSPFTPATQAIQKPKALELRMLHELSNTEHEQCLV